MHTLHIVLAHVHSMDSGTGNLITHLCSTCYIHDSHYLRSILMNIFHDQLCIVPCGSMTCDANYSHSHYLCSIFGDYFHTFHIVLFPHSHPITLFLLCSTWNIHDSHYLCSMMVVVVVVEVHTLHIVLFPHSHLICLLCSTCYILDSHYLCSIPIPMNIFHGQLCIVPCGSMTCDANYSGAHDHSHYLCCIFRSILQNQWCIVL